MINQIKFYFALFILKAAKVFLKLIRRNIPYYPGYLALKVCKDFCALAKKPNLIVAVSGTNGKTTSTSLIVDALNHLNIKTIQNEGYNYITGLASTLGNSLNILGRQKYQALVFECDERYAAEIIPILQPHHFILTNIMRDSMKYNGHVFYIKNMLEESISPKVKLIINSDDLLVSSLNKYNNAIYYSIDKTSFSKNKPYNSINDLIYCPNCGTKLIYEFVHYHHIGKVHCPNCHLGQQEINYRANFDLNNQEILVNGQVFPAKVDSIFNAYNILQLIAFLKEINISYENIVDTLNSIKLDNKRFTIDNIGDYRLVFHTAKGQNAFACSVVFDYIRNADGDKIVLLMLDDVLDNRDSTEAIAWIYDADFEFLNDSNIKQIIVGGKRHLDYKVRLLFAGVSEDKIFTCENEIDMPSLINYDCAKNIYLLFELFGLDLAKAVKFKILKTLENKYDN